MTETNRTYFPKCKQIINLPGELIFCNFIDRNQVEGESQPLLQQQQNQQQQQIVPLQDSYMQSRAEALQNVESTIHELSSIFNQLATLVSQQGEIAIRYHELKKFGAHQLKSY